MFSLVIQDLTKNSPLSGSCLTLLLLLSIVVFGLYFECFFIVRYLEGVSTVGLSRLIVMHTESVFYTSKENVTSVSKRYGDLTLSTLYFFFFRETCEVFQIV